ncbi:MAG: SDR family NAD(P)-dependent oxidoreductase [Egibacteraceae bacterium]
MLRRAGRPRPGHVGRGPAARRRAGVDAGRGPDAAAGAEAAQRLLRTAGRLSGGQAARETRLATALADPGLQATAAALAAGRISPGQADALAQAARTHPGLIASAQEELVDQASEQADLIDADQTRRMFDAVRERFGRLDVLVLNASGGLERHVPADYAMRLNRDAQMRAVDLALPLMPDGGRGVFVTSHYAHFHGESRFCPTTSRSRRANAPEKTPCAPAFPPSPTTASPWSSSPATSSPAPSPPPCWSAPTRA